MFNKVVLVGNLTRDIELRYFQNGTAIGKTGIAVSRKFNAGNGEKGEETCFIDLIFFGKTAEIANQYLSKGSKILVEGRLKFEQWIDNNGQNRSKHTISVDSMEMLGGNPQQNNGGGYQGYNNQSNFVPNNSYNNTDNFANSNFSNNSYQQNNGYNENNYTRQNFQQPKSYNVQQNDYSQDIPEVDVDADDAYDNDETIPF